MKNEAWRSLSKHEALPKVSVPQSSIRSFLTIPVKEAAKVYSVARIFFYIKEMSLIPAMRKNGSGVTMLISH